jgi:hypothetical protein
LYGLTTGVYDLLGEGAYGLSHAIGNIILPILEGEFGLELAGEKPADFLQEIGRYMVDEFGFAKDVEIVDEGDVYKMKFKVYLVEANIGVPFICPYLALANAAFNRLGIKAMSKIDYWEEGEGSIITFDLL